MAIVFPSKQVVCHQVANAPSKKHKLKVSGFKPAQHSVNVSCLFLIRPLNSQIYILCVADVSPDCMRMSNWPSSQHRPQIFADVEERAAAQEGVSECWLTGDGFIGEKFHF